MSFAHECLRYTPNSFGCRFFGNRVLSVVVLCAAFAACAGLQAQEIATIIDLDNGDTVPDFSFGLELTRDGTGLYAAVPGDIFSPNRRIVEIDTSSDTVVGDGQTGLFPEEVAIRYDLQGLVETIFVSNNSDGTVSVLDPNLTPIGLIDLTVVGGYYPFGLLIGPDDRYLYVSTVNAGEIFRIDTDPGPTYLQIVDTYYVAAFNGRLALHGNKLVIPGTDWLLGAVLSVLDVDNPTQVETIVLDGNTAGWPGANDLVVVPGGFAYVPVLDFNSSGLLYEVDLEQTPPLISRTIDMLGTHVEIYEHGVDASLDGNTLVVTCIDGPLMIVGRKAGCVLSELDLSAYAAGQGNEALFSSDGRKVYVSDQGGPNIFVIEGVPQHGLLLSGTQSAPLGGQADFALRGGEVGEQGVLIASLNLGPTPFPEFTLELGVPMRTIHQDRFDAGNDLAIPTLNVPNWPGLVGRSVYLQGLTRDTDGEIRPSNLHELSVQ